MRYALLLAAPLHVIATVFWAGSTFALARTGGAAMERLFKPQLGAAVLAFVTGGYLGHTLHAHAFGRAEQALFAAIAASAVALVVQIVGVGRATLALRDAARDQAAPRALAVRAHRVAAALLALAAIGMASARYLPSSSTDAAGTPVPSDAAWRDRSVEASPQAVAVAGAGAAPRPRADAVRVIAPAGVR